MAVQGAIPLSHDAAFPSGAFVVGAVEPVADFDAAAPVGGGQRPQKLDKVTGLPMWSVPVIDGDETAKLGPVRSAIARWLWPDAKSASICGRSSGADSASHSHDCTAALA